VGIDGELRAAVTADASWRYSRGPLEEPAAPS
jgi:hypothetical protein